LDFGKSYASVEEEAYRIKVFAENLKFIEMNSDDQVQFGVNDFADLSPMEFKAIYLGAKPPKRTVESKPSRLMSRKANLTIPNSVDWTAAGDVTPP
jgi:hypothetical protein